MHAIASYNMGDVLVNAPKFAIFIIVGPTLALTILKVWLTARATSKDRLKKKEWVLSHHRDEEGIPLLAEAVKRSQHNRVSVSNDWKRR